MYVCVCVGVCEYTCTHTCVHAQVCVHAAMHACGYMHVHSDTFVNGKSMNSKYVL